MKKPLQYISKDDGQFPNNKLPVLHYKKVLELPALFPASFVRRLFKKHNWTNNWRAGIYTYAHYHSVTHEAMGVIKGKTRLQMGGDKGKIITITAGDVLVIPAGVAHKNLGLENDVICIGGYPDGKDYDMNYGMPEERPKADRKIVALPNPETDPVFGEEGLPEIWGVKKAKRKVAVKKKVKKATATN